MDAHAHLISLGWAGPGHALDSRPIQSYKQHGKQGLDYKSKKSSNTGSGLVKPLMISQRKDRFGLGKKDPAHEPAAGNQWWLKGFETALGNIGKSESERSGTSTPIQTQVGGQKHQKLYDFFIKGQQMEGTISREAPKKKNKKRKSDQISDEVSECEENTLPKTGTTQEFMQAATYLAVRDKDQKRRTRVEKSGSLEEFKQASAFFQLGEDLENEQRTYLKASIPKPISIAQVENPPPVETKEERKERRRRRKEEKTAKKSQSVDEENSSPLIPQEETSRQKQKQERGRLKDQG